MKILEVCHRYYPYIGGVEEHVKNISERIAKKFSVTVCTTDPSNELPNYEVVSGVEVKRFRCWAPNEAYYFSRALKRYLTENSENYDVVHAHHYHAFPSLYAAQTKGNKRFVFTPHYHGEGHTFFRSLLHIPYKHVAKKIFEKADSVVCVSNHEKRLIIEKFNLDSKKFVVIPNGVDMKEFEGFQKKKGEKKVILCVSRLERYKGVQYLIEALARLSQDVVLEVVGDGPHKESLIELTRKLGAEGRVKFFGNLPRKALLQKYARADLFALLSTHEAFGICIAEALVSKTACIVANTSALKEWVDNKNCFGIDLPIDVNKLVELIGRVIGMKVTGVSLMDWDDVVKQLLRIYVGDCADS